MPPSSCARASANAHAPVPMQVLDQFERNEDQQQFLLSIWDTIDRRSKEQPAEFARIPLTLLGEVCENGVQTLTSVADVGGRGAELCTRAMTTLLQTYVAERRPDDWKALFKEATNVAFMIKYMFRESLPLARCATPHAHAEARARPGISTPPPRHPLAHKSCSLFAARQHFLEVAGRGESVAALEKPALAKALLTTLTRESIDAYGSVGLYDPAELAKIDFLSRPELLIGLVEQMGARARTEGRADLQLLSEICVQWMHLMVGQGLPPLAPHHTQAIVVLMMARFYEAHLLPQAQGVRQPLPLKCFVAQMATGEGKSIVIAMVAVFLIRRHRGLRVHILENNQGLLERDYRQNRPFFDRFGITSGTDLQADVQVCYTLKREIGRHFLRQMVRGTLEAEASQTVLIVDEVDDLIVNEAPNSHYVKGDVELSPQLVAAFAALKAGSSQPPDGVGDVVWRQARDAVTLSGKMQKDKHWRLVQSEDGRTSAIMLDEQGRVPKVPQTAGWLQWVNYVECGIKPEAETSYCTVCTPFVFSKYAGIFGLTGSVGGAAELRYLARTCDRNEFDPLRPHSPASLASTPLAPLISVASTPFPMCPDHAIKLDVPRFLETCEGAPPKVVVNHGVELHDGRAALVARAVQIAGEYFRRVPVLIIASSTEELDALYHAVSCNDAIPAEDVQRFAEFDSSGFSLRDQWQVRRCQCSHLTAPHTSASLLRQSDTLRATG